MMRIAFLLGAFVLIGMAFYEYAEECLIGRTIEISWPYLLANFASVFAAFLYGRFEGRR